jgi:acyl-CoA synthetase (AMP-forming)/AMP-acid ligase II/archaellum component FlaC
MASLSSTFLRSVGAGDKSIDAAGRVKLVTLRELPKSLYATKLAVTTYPSSRRERKAIFNHIEVYKMVETIANKLREAGVRPGTVCAMALPNSFEAIVYFFALQWIGAIAAPIDTTLDTKDFVKQLRSVRAQTLVSPFLDASDAREDALYNSALEASEELKICNWHVYRTINEGVILETGGHAMGSAAWSGGAGDFKLDPDEIAVHVASDVAVLPLSHRALTAAAKSFASTYKLAMGMSTMLIPPIHDIQGILVLIAVFYTGGHLVLPGSNAGDSDKFWELAKTHDISWVSASPEFVMDIYEAHPKRSSSQELSFVRSCGGRMVPDVVTKIEDTLNCPILESCGVAEAAGLATANTLSDSKLGTVGKAVDGVEVAVFSTRTGEMIEKGSSQEGEVAVCGEQVTSGYLVKEITDESIYETQAFGSEGSVGRKTWLATGKRGTMDSAGYLTILDGSSRDLRTAELAAMEEQKRRETAEQERLDARRREEEEARRMEAERTAARNAALAKAGVPEGIDDETADAILARLAAIEANQARLEHELADKHASELEDLRARLEEAESAAERAARGERVTDVLDGRPQVLDVRMEELEAAVMAAAASAEMSANNTREAAKVAREVAESAYGSNQSRDVAITSATGDQGSLTKTVRVALDDVEAAMRNHPAVLHARAFGRKDRRFGAEVFCAIVPKKGARVSEPWLKLHAQSVLPAPMVPKKFYYLDELPMHMSRRELAESPLLKDLSAFSGYTEVKHVKGPAFRPLQRGATVAGPRPMHPQYQS